MTSHNDDDLAAVAPGQGLRPWGSSHHNDASDAEEHDAEFGRDEPLVAVVGKFQLGKKNPC